MAPGTRLPSTSSTIPRARAGGLEKIEFADGTSLTLHHEPNTSWVNGTPGDDTLTGQWDKDIFRAAGGTADRWRERFH
ncbi:hypothetical protein [Rhizobium sullae]|uniref:hypothetical protein n=1 Tax=Rhizobium sullae TaxID=50338 RepID=UPI000B35F68E|nr:hypothetical protein [Rhizobium sullae]